MEITENHAASSSQLHLQAVWHVAKLQVHGRGQVAIKSVVLWGNVTLHKDDEESEVHARSLSHPAMQTHLLKLLAHGCEHRHPSVLQFRLATPAEGLYIAILGQAKRIEVSHRSLAGNLLGRDGPTHLYTFHHISYVIHRRLIQLIQLIY